MVRIDHSEFCVVVQPPIPWVLRDMKSKALFAASTLAFIVGLASLVLFMEMFDVNPQTWGPRGVEFPQWHAAWIARRNLYVLLVIGSFLAAMALFVAGLFRRSAAHNKVLREDKTERWK